MSRGRKKSGRSAPAAPVPADGGAKTAAALVAAALAGSALLVDPGAQAAFDAPKRLTALVLVAAAAAAAFLFAARGDSFPSIWRGAGTLPRASLVLAAAALAGSLVSALLSPRRELALDSLRVVGLLALLLPLGASRVAARFGRHLLAVFLSLSAVNAIVSILQARGIWQPFALAATGMRDTTGAFVGNVGYLATSLGLAAVAALAVAATTRSGTVRIACLAVALLALADLVIDQNLTSLVAVAAGGAAFFAARFRRRAIAPTAVVVAVLLLAVAVYRPARTRAAETLAALRAGDWDRLLTYRLGPWSAAAEMMRERPLAGYGPGTFGAEFVPHRLKAEIRARRRYVNPLVTSSYGEAHSEPLQALAEGGVAGALALASFGALLAAVAGASRRGAAPDDEASLLGAVLVAGTVIALAWFPIQRPVSAIPLLLAAGRGWRLAAGADPETS
jgi:O-antigen ligase